MRWRLWFFLLALTACGHASDGDDAVSAESALGSLVVTTEGGDVQGALDRGARSWRGIPYAAPPTHERRWRAPDAVIPWSGVKNATTWSTPCLQLDEQDE